MDNDQDPRQTQPASADPAVFAQAASSQQARQQPTAPSPPLTQQAPVSDIPFYRRYWPFGLIFMFAPLGVLFGIIVLATGTIYRTKNGQTSPISTKEKITLTVVAIIIQSLTFLRLLVNVLR